MKQSHNVKIEVDQYYVGDEGKMKKSSFVKKKWGVYKNEGKQTLFEFKRVWDKQKDVTFHVRNTYPTYSLTCLMASLHVCYS